MLQWNDLCLLEMIFAHLLLLVLSVGVIWVLSGLLVNTTERVAKRYNKPGFAVAFFVLGFITSIGEFSVATNATLAGVPQVAAGNLIGGSMVMFLLLIPLLAVLGGGVSMKNALAMDHLALLLLVAVLPSILILDGDLTRLEGVLIVLFYALLFYVVKKRRPMEEVIEDTIEEVQEDLLHHKSHFFKHHASLIDISKITLSGVMIFFAGNILVKESLFFSELLSIPPSLVGLLLLSIGTNIPEIVIAIRCIVSKQKEIAFGNYLGSAIANTLLIGFIGIVNGSFNLEHSEFLPAIAVFIVGIILFYIFSRTKQDISRKEGMVLLCLYTLFLLTEIVGVIHFTGD